MISAVDLIKGIGLCAGLQVPEVPGATGNLDTNFTGKADAALALLRDGCDFAYIHMEAPDECGHHGEAENKVKAIERIDRDVVGRLLDGLKGEAFFYADFAGSPHADFPPHAYGRPCAVPALPAAARRAMRRRAIHGGAGREKPVFMCRKGTG